MKIGPLAIGAYVPETCIDNQTIAAWSDAPLSWIGKATGIHTRRYAGRNEGTATLAHNAVVDLLQRHPSALDGLTAIIVVTSTKDRRVPPTAASLQHRLGLSGVPCFDLDAVCSGAIYALWVADALLRTGPPDARILVVAVDKYSRHMDRKDRATVSLFGDGAGALVLGRVPDDRGCQAIRVACYGEYEDLVSISPEDDRFRMAGHAVADYVREHLPAILRAACKDAGVELGDIARFVFHQANPRLLGEVAQGLGIPEAAVPLTAPKYGNTGAASVLITLSDAYLEGEFNDGDLVAIGVIGGGMTDGAMLLRWAPLLPGFARSVEAARETHGDRR